MSSGELDQAVGFLFRASYSITHLLLNLTFFNASFQVLYMPDFNKMTSHEIVELSR